MAKKNGLYLYQTAIDKNIDVTCFYIFEDGFFSLLERVLFFSVIERFLFFSVIERFLFFSVIERFLFLYRR